MNAWVAAFLAERCVPGVEQFTDGVYRRSLVLERGPGVLSVDDHVRYLGDSRDAPAAHLVADRLCDVDADSGAIDAHLGRDPLLAPLVAARPAIRVPGAAGGFEIAVRAIVGQQVSVAAARTIAGRLAAVHGEPLAAPAGSIARCFPSPSSLAAIDPATLPMPRARASCLTGMAAAVAAGLPAEADALAELPGVGPWTRPYIALRLGDRDAFPASDLGVRHAMRRLGAPDDVPAITRHAERWRPYRAYAVQHLWASLTSPP